MDIGTGSGNRTQFTHGTFPSWCTESWGPVRIDLSGVGFIDTMGLVTVMAAADRARMDGVAIEFEPPHPSSKAAVYAARMHLGECLGHLGIDAGLRRVNENDVGSRLVELHRFSSTDADALAERVHAAVGDNSGDPETAKDFYLGVSEVLWNVVDHSTIESGWAAMQVFPNQGSPNITFAIADAGVGLRTSLARTHPVETDTDALDLAFQAGVTGTGDKRGMGLSDLFDRVTRRRGIVRVWSGNAIGVGRRGPGMAVSESNTPLQGTIIYAAFTPGGSKEVAS